MGETNNFHGKVINYLMNNSRVNYKKTDYSYELSLFMDFIGMDGSTHNFPSPIFSMTYTKYIEAHLEEIFGLNKEDMKPIINDYYMRIKGVSEKKSKFISYVREKLLNDTVFDYDKEIILAPTNGEYPSTPFKSVSGIDVIKPDSPVAEYTARTYGVTEIEVKVLMDIYLSNIKYEVEHQKKKGLIPESENKQDKLYDYIVDDLLSLTTYNTSKAFGVHVDFNGTGSIPINMIVYKELKVPLYFYSKNIYGVTDEEFEILFDIYYEKSNFFERFRSI